MPADGKTTPGHDVIFTCTVDLNILADFYLVWTRHTGSVHTKIAEGTLKQDDFLDNKRYKLSKHRSGVKKEYYTLTISGNPTICLSLYLVAIVYVKRCM